MIKKGIVSTIILVFILNTSILINASDWGLGFNKEVPNEVPQGDETAEYLKQYEAYYVDDCTDKVLYLTFDSGYENGFTEDILDVLKENDVPATFFLVGTYLKKNPEIVQRMVDEGHIVGNHTMKHADMTNLSKNNFKKDLNEYEEVYKSVVGEDLKKYYRPPSGKYCQSNLEAAKEIGYKTIFWSASYKDYDDDNQPSADTAISTLMPRIHPGGIILLHSTSKTSANILEEFIHKCKEMGYEFKSLDDI